jgi:pilus assembly protein Flp/PilA
MLKIQMFIHKLMNPVQNVEGAVGIEYGLLAALIAVAFIVGATALGGALDGLFNDIATKLGVAVP